MRVFDKIKCNALSAFMDFMDLLICLLSTELVFIISDSCVHFIYANKSLI